ncbi:MAG TPA: zinc-binding dehydrogenase, partial [Caulobacter sp.]|nr:zinc-binding dehydrogenase [Caulobacter sp.]
PNEVSVRVLKRMVHPIDSLLIRGIVPMPIDPEGSAPGTDGVGIVEEVGSGVDPSTGLVAGARVIIFHAHGTWSERILADAETLIPIPDDIDDATASQLSINGITAIMLMRAATAADNQAGITSPLLVTAAGAAVARNVLALARMRGMKAVALVRSASGAAILAEVFNDVPIVSMEREDWPATVVQAGGVAPSVAIDPIGGEMAPKLLALLADGGTLLTYGGLDPRPSQISTIAMTIHHQTIKGVTAPTWLTTTSPEQRRRDISDLFEIARQAPRNFGEYEEFDLQDVVEAIAATQATPRRMASILVSK